MRGKEKLNQKYHIPFISILMAPAFWDTAIAVKKNLHNNKKRTYSYMAVKYARFMYVKV